MFVPFAVYHKKEIQFLVLKNNYKNKQYEKDQKNNFVCRSNNFA